MRGTLLEKTCFIKGIVWLSASLSANGGGVLISKID